jgi:formylglycine-generating enzyme required for sulfatase activity
MLPDAKDLTAALGGWGLPGRMRTEAPLGDRAKLLRALAPLLRRQPDPRHLRLDEERTVEVYADTRLLQPVMVPCPGPAFDEVVVMIDGGVSMQVWRPQAEELRAVLASSQVFPRVRLQTLNPDQLNPQTPRPGKPSSEEPRRRAPSPPPADRLLLLLSDATGRHWWDGSMLDTLERWARTSPTAILQPLPPWHWVRTALGVAPWVSVRNTSPAAINPSYRADPQAGEDPKEQEGEQPETAPAPAHHRPLPVPVLPLNRESLRIWSAVVMGDPAYASAGVALPDGKERQKRLRERLGGRDLTPPATPPAALAPQDAEARWEAFQKKASPEAQRLLLAMASAPLLTLPVIRLLLAASAPEATSPLPMAEVLTGGLVIRLPGQETVNGPEGKPPEVEQLQFTVLPGMAPLLRERLSARERMEVIRRVTALVERRWNQRRQASEPSFEALLCDPTVAPAKETAGVVRFASVMAHLLDTLPDDRARTFAERIRRGTGLPQGSPWPDAMAFEEEEFATARLVTAPELETFRFATARRVELTLARIPFQSARLELIGHAGPPVDLPARLASEGRKESSHRIRWIDAETRGFHEPLGREMLPFGATADGPGPLTLTLVEIPAGEYSMGSSDEEPERFNGEEPRHRVSLEGFFLGQSPITQAQWRVVAQWEEREGERWGRTLQPDPSRFQPSDDKSRDRGTFGSFHLLEGETTTDERPVDSVTWDDAMEFCQRLSQRTGRHYTLPSEAQWEYACRAGTTTPFAFGDTLTDELANCDARYAYANGPKGEWRQQTTPVGRFPANAWGLYDMHGNVWEWCLDHWHQNYEGAPEDGSAWLYDGEKKKEADHLLRGGSWFNRPWSCRSACRDRLWPGFVIGSVGFRVVCLPQGRSTQPSIP